jgi:hypothetical protein
MRIFTFIILSFLVFTFISNIFSIVSFDGQRLVNYIILLFIMSAITFFIFVLPPLILIFLWQGSYNYYSVMMVSFISIIAGYLMLKISGYNNLNINGFELIQQGRATIYYYLYQLLTYNMTYLIAFYVSKLRR